MDAMWIPGTECLPPDGGPQLCIESLVDQMHALMDAMENEDLSGLTDVEAHERVLGLVRARIRIETLLMDAMEVWDARKIWCSDGSKSAGARIAAETGVDKAHVNAVMRRMKKLKELPATKAAMAAGKLSPEVADAMYEASRVELDVPFSEVEQTLVDASILVGSKEARSVLKRWAANHDRAGQEERERRNHENRKLSVAETLDGMIHLNGLLPAVAGREFRSELDRLEKELRRQDKRDGVTRNAQQRQADALAIMARRSATLSDDEVDAKRAPRILLSVVVGRGTVEHLCETLSGVPLPTGELIPELERLDLERLIFDGPDTIVSVSSQRTFTGALRRAILVRDGRCTHPSVCDTPAEHCDVDHEEPWSQHGITCQTNGRVQCQPHNRHKDLHDRAPNSGEHRIWRPPRGWIPDTTRRPGSAHQSNPNDADDPDDSTRAG